jgi:AraC family transcriptional regulator
VIHCLVQNIGYILHERAQQFYGEGVGWLSIKSFHGGQAYYRVGRAHYLADETSYLILNHGQPYAITIDAETPVESFCLFFAPDFAAEVQHSLAASTERLLAQPYSPQPQVVNFFERTYPHDSILSPSLLQLRQMVNQLYCERSWLTEQFHQMMEQLLQAHIRVIQEVETLPAARAATREELYRRLHLAKDFAAAAFNQSLTLEDMAAVAGLSANHLLRTFKHLFRQTPYQYLTTRRLEQAQKLLRQTDCPVTDICFAVGFESLGAFSWLFRRRVGLSPIEYRRQTR